MELISQDGGLPLVKSSLIVLILALATLANGDTSPEPKPISLTVGSFFVGREPYPMYVEYFTPARPTHQTPIVLIHGGATTGGSVCQHTGWPRGLGDVL